MELNKICNKCNINLTTTNAVKRENFKYKNICKPCYNKYKSNHNKNIQRIDRLKTFVECENCNEYCINRKGRAFCSLICKFIAYIDTWSNKNGCWLWTSKLDKEGYGHILINYKTKRASRISYELFNGNIPSSLFVCHNCPNGDNPTCVNPAHLWIGNNKDNQLDYYRKIKEI